MSKFAPTGGSPAVSSTTGSATNPSIAAYSLPTAGTDVTLTLPANTVRFLLKARSPGCTELKIRYIAVTGDQLTIRPGGYYFEDYLNKVSFNIYVQSNKVSTVVELVTWTA